MPQKQFRQIKGLVLHEDTDRRLYHPVVSYLSENDSVVQYQFDSKSEGIFKIYVPQDLAFIVVANRYYISQKIPLHPEINDYIIRLKRSPKNDLENVYDVKKDNYTYKVWSKKED